jgi:hypothetical protein
MQWQLKELLDKLRAAGFEVDRTTGQVTLHGVRVEDAYITGAFDTSDGGTGTGLLAEFASIRFFYAGVATARISTDLGGMIELHNEANTTALRLSDAGATLSGPGVTILGLSGMPITLTAAGGVKTGSSGTPVLDRRRFVINHNPLSVPANSAATFDIPLGTTLPGTNSEWTAILTQGVHSDTTPLSYSGAAVLASMTSVRVYVRNPTAAAIDLVARDFHIICERWA